MKRKTHCENARCMHWSLKGCRLKRVRLDPRGVCTCFFNITIEQSLIDERRKLFLSAHKVSEKEFAKLREDYERVHGKKNAQ